MTTPVLMPQVGQDLKEGVLIEWKVAVGDAIAKGDIVAVVESEKASFEVEAFQAGTVLELLYEAGDTATVLEPLLLLGDEGETGDDGNAGTQISADAEAEDGAPPKTPATETVKPAPAEQPAAGKPGSSSPLARRLAARHGLDIAQVQGTGPKGSVVKRDIEAAVADGKAMQDARPGAPAMASPKGVALAPAGREDREEPFDRMRQVIADRLVLSKQTIPHFYLRTQVDVTDLLIRRRAHLEAGGDKMSLNDVIVHATAQTLLEYPRLNAHVAEDRVILKGSVNIGIAVSVENGLMVPVVENAPFRPVSEIAAMVRDLAAAARRGMTKSSAQGTFSISNLGMFGVEVIPIINPPEAAILGVGPVDRTVREHRGGIHVRDMMALTLSADHRAVDGAYGARFLQSLGETLTAYNAFSETFQATGA